MWVCLAMFSGVGALVSDEPTATIVGLALVIFGWLAKKYVVPMLQAVMNKNLAERLLMLADDVTDDLVAKNPKSEPIQLFDQMVDELCKVAKVKKEVGKRVIRANLERKK